MMIYNKNLLFIDTSGFDQYIYQPTFNHLKKLGYKINYINHYNLTETTLNHYNQVFFVIDCSFIQPCLQDLKQYNMIKNPLIKNTLEHLKIYSQRNNIFLAISLPKLPLQLINTVIDLLNKMFNMIDISYSAEINNYLTITLPLIFKNETKDCPYDTALLPKTSIKEKQRVTIKPLMTEKQKKIAQLLPFTQTNPLFNCLMPGGIILENYAKHNKYLITKNTIIDMNGIKENFTLNPVDKNLRSELLQLQELWWQEVDQVLNSYEKKCDTQFFTIVKNNIANLKDRKQKIFNQRIKNNFINKKYCKIIKEKIWCGWTGLDAYKNKESESARNILQSGLNLLWIEFNPEWYLSQNAIKKEHKETWLQNIRNFTYELQQESKKLHRPIPLIFVGTDITSNFSIKTPTDKLIDIYGKEYPNVPCPFDQQFWQTELLDVIKEFVELWNKDIGNGLILNGIFLDLEMYHAQQQTSNFGPLTDFSDTSWHYYCDKKSLNLKNLSVTDRITYLFKNHLLPEYFDFQLHHAYELGCNLKEEFKKILPDGLLAAYNINLPHSWFYLGIMRGLSSLQEPIILATFNNDFYSHHNWLQDHQIHALHMPVVLLSKLRTINDFNFVGCFAQQHDGVWFNRIERLEQSRDKKDWAWNFGVEVTPLDTYLFIQQLHRLIKKIQH